MQKRMTMIRLAAVAAVAVLTVLPVTPASAAATPADSALHKAPPSAKQAAPTVGIGLSCDSGIIYVSAYGKGLTAGGQVKVTRSVFDLMPDGTRRGETSRTITETVAADGTVYSQDPFGTPPMASGWTDGEATIRDLAGSVIVVSPVASVICPGWW